MVTFANPYNACTTCGVRVTDYVDNANVPCGHTGFDRYVEVGSCNAVPVKGSKPPTWTEHVEPWKSVCPSWGPVDGCTCDPPCALPQETAKVEWWHDY